MRLKSFKKPLIVFLVGICLVLNSAVAQKSRPNIIFILVDDLGYGDLGTFYQDDFPTGPKFDTPFIDQMAGEGMKLTHHYVAAPVCAPSRASFLLGLHQGHAAIRDNQFDKELPDALNVATLLKAAGYKTIHIGKNGLAGKKGSNVSAHPLKRGFDTFFGYLHHSHAHEHYPRNGTTNKSAIIYDGYDQITTNLDLVYTTDLFTARAKKEIIDQTAKSPDQPFFMYLAYDVPHQKMQIPSVAYPSGKGLDGGLKWTGAGGTPAYVNSGVGEIDSHVHPDYQDRSWDISHKKHVTMIRRVDTALEDIFQLLRDLEIEENTLVVFTSDHGPHNARHDPRFFRSYAHLEGIKRDIWEGGIRVPTIVKWPAVIPAGSVNPVPSGFWDWLPTFASVSGLSIPAFTDGIDLLPALKNKVHDRGEGYLYFEYFHPGKTPAYSDFQQEKQGRGRKQMQAVRIGKYKGVRVEIQGHDDDFEIYDVVNDPSERNNLASVHVELQAQMKDLTLRSRIVNETAARPYDPEYVPTLELTAEPVNGINYAVFEGSYEFVPDFSIMEVPEETGIVSSLSSVGERSDDHGVWYHGLLKVPESGVYTFTLESGGAAHFRLHNAHVINNDYGSNLGRRSGSIRLEKGFHPYSLYSLVEGGRPIVKLSYQYNNEEEKEVAGGMLFVTDHTVLTAFDDLLNPELTLYPNPADSIISIHTHQKTIRSYKILDTLSGREVADQKVKAASGPLNIDVSKLPKGVFVLVVRYVDGGQSERKFLIN